MCGKPGYISIRLMAVWKTRVYINKADGYVENHGTLLHKASRSVENHGIH